MTNYMYRLEAERAYDAWSELETRYRGLELTSGQKAALTRAWHQYCRLAKLAGLDPHKYAEWKSKP